MLQSKNINFAIYNLDIAIRLLKTAAPPFAAFRTNILENCLKEIRERLHSEITIQKKLDQIDEFFSPLYRTLLKAPPDDVVVAILGNTFRHLLKELLELSALLDPLKLRADTRNSDKDIPITGTEKCTESDAAASSQHVHPKCACDIATLLANLEVAKELSKLNGRENSSQLELKAELLTPLIENIIARASRVQPISYNLRCWITHLDLLSHSDIDNLALPILLSHYHQLIIQIIKLVSSHLES